MDNFVITSSFLNENCFYISKQKWRRWKWWEMKHSFESRERVGRSDFSPSASQIILDLGSCGITQCAHSSQLTAPLCTQARTNTNTHFYPLEIAVQFSDSQSRLNVGAIYWSPKFWFQRIISHDNFSSRPLSSISDRFLSDRIDRVRTGVTFEHHSFSRNMKVNW